MAATIERLENGDIRITDSVPRVRVVKVEQLNRDLVVAQSLLAKTQTRVTELQEAITEAARLEAESPK
jgi:hypothetical protein